MKKRTLIITLEVETTRTAKKELALVKAETGAKQGSVMVCDATKGKR